MSSRTADGQDGCHELALKWLSVVVLSMIGFAWLRCGFISDDVRSSADLLQTHVIYTRPPSWLVAAEVAEAQEVREARALFASAGLEFPDVAIRFDSDFALCDQKGGRFRPRPEGPDVVDVCYERTDQRIGHVVRARMLWHELAHAWIQSEVDLVTREATLDMLGLGGWREGDWADRGSERAAEVLVWGMKDGRYRTHSRMPDMGCDLLASVYQAMTAATAPPCSHQEAQDSMS